MPAAQAINSQSNSKWIHKLRQKNIESAATRTHQATTTRQTLQLPTQLTSLMPLPRTVTAALALLSMRAFEQYSVLKLSIVHLSEISAQAHTEQR
jgi:hypothetical protein